MGIVVIVLLGVVVAAFGLGLGMLASHVFYKFIAGWRFNAELHFETLVNPTRNVMNNEKG